MLALYALQGKGSLEEFLDGIFADATKTTVEATEPEKADCNAFKERYKKAMDIERLPSKLI